MKAGNSHNSAPHDEALFEAYDLPHRFPIACGLTLEERRSFISNGFIVVREGEAIPRHILEAYGLVKPQPLDPPALRLVGASA